ncbi:MAG: hypothetical protein IKQ44_10725 [Lachnospiraceae bacterium]|nr:hypothetical protein [Lachnospiraceae bacterium]
MIILNKKMSIKEVIEYDDKEYFPEDKMVKAVADVDRQILAVNAALHADLEELLLNNGSKQSSLYGFNIYEDNEIEYDSLINPPRNRDDGFPRGGRDVSSPKKREMIKEIVDKWIQRC